MKRLFLILGIFGMLFSLFNSKSIAKADETLVLNSAYCVLIEPKSKRILYKENEDEKLYPASMTKMMGMLLIMEGIEEGKISFKDEVICSDYASSMGGTQIYLEPGEKMTLEDLFKAVAINSANDAIVCLGEHLMGSNELFVKRMNEKAKILGMNNTSFMNATGFDDPNHYTTPFDMAILACELLKYEKDVLKYSSLKESYVRENSDNPFWLVNTNKMLGAYEGMDGLKTGYTNKAGYNLTATAKRNGVRLVSVVMHEKDIKSRSKDTTTLLNYGFSLLKAMSIYKANEIITTYKFNNSMDELVGLVTHDDVTIIVNKNTNLDDLNVEIILDTIEPPISDDIPIGILLIRVNNQEFKFDVYSEKSLPKPSFFDYFWMMILNLLS